MYFVLYYWCVLGFSAQSAKEEDRRWGERFIFVTKNRLLCSRLTLCHSSCFCWNSSSSLEPEPSPLLHYHTPATPYPPKNNATIFIPAGMLSFGPMATIAEMGVTKSMSYHFTHGRGLVSLISSAILYPSKETVLIWHDTCHCHD